MFFKSISLYTCFLTIFYYIHSITNERKGGNMALDKIGEIECKIKSAEKLDDNQKAELLILMTELKKELSGVASQESARKIASHAEKSTDIALSDKNIIKENPNPLNELENSVGGFEVSHPHLVQIVNRICIMLSNIGI